MPSFSKASLRELATCDERLQRICHEAIKHFDFMVIQGHRGQKEQDEAFKAGTSKLPWPKSRHNSEPSTAVDLAPCPLNWKDLPSFHRLAGVIMTVAAMEGIELTWGGDWKSFKDLPHFELKKP